MSVNNNKVERGYRNETHLPKRSSIYMGLVRKNFDAQRMGRLLVWVSDFGPDTPEYWIPCSYASPFAGSTPVSKTVENGKTMEDSQQTYGWWATPPDVDNQVLVCFLDGDIANAFWFACIYPQNMNHMIPGIGGNASTDPATNAEFGGMAPVVEYNKFDTFNEPVTSKGYKQDEREKVERPPFRPLAEALKAQGLLKDNVRGTSSTSARRESPSRVHGLLTPRGHSFQIDDGFKPEEGGEPENEFIRFRTRNGVQILINDTEGFIYLITKGGKSWVEISDGGIDMFSAESISMNSDKDINLNAGGQVGINGAKAVHVSSAFYSSFTTGDTSVVAGGKVLVDAVDDIGLKSSRDVSLDGVRDVTANAGRNILDGACGYISHNAMFIRDNSGGSPPPEVPHAQFERTPITRLPQAEPWTRANNPNAKYATDANGNLVEQVRNSDGNLVDQPLPPPKGVTDDDIDWLTTCMIDEAGAESDEGKAAVAQVVLNRLATNYNVNISSNKVANPWKGRIKGVVLARHQFSGFWFGSNYSAGPVAKSYPAAERRGQQKQAQYKNRSDWKSTKAIAEQVIAGTYKNSGGFTSVKSKRCNLYYNPGISNPAWARKSAYVCKIGNHKFHKD
jgi:spore germination cell wall hydrolase CwlJ-like protein